MSGQGSSPDDEIHSSNMRGGESMRETSSRSGAAGGLVPPPRNAAASMMNNVRNNSINNINNDGDDGSSAAAAGGTAGISSSGSSRSTARAMAAAASAGGQQQPTMNAMMQQQGHGFTSTGSGSSQDVIMHENSHHGADAIGSGGPHNQPHHFNNAYHPQFHENNDYYSSSAGAPSSQTAGSTYHHNHNNSSAATQQLQQHYSQYSSVTYPGELTVYSWGRGEDGQLGIGDTSDQDEPTYVDALRGVGVKQIACGSGHTVVLTGEGEVYTWGRGDDGRLGHGDNGWKYVPRLTHSLTGQIITQVTCGSYHTAAVSSNGDLYTWGGGMYGKLGHGNESGHSTPRRVEALVGLVVVDIACGSRHTAVVTNRGCLYTWGDKENGVAGHGDTEGHQYLPKLLERLSGKKVVQLSACGFHTGCLTDQGECFTWGEVRVCEIFNTPVYICTHFRLFVSM